MRSRLSEVVIQGVNGFNQKPVHIENIRQTDEGRHTDARVTPLSSPKCRNRDVGALCCNLLGDAEQDSPGLQVCSKGLERFFISIHCNL